MQKAKNDLKTAIVDHFPQNKGMVNEYWSDDFCSGHGVSSSIRIFQMCRAISRQLQSKRLYLSGSISLPGLCPINISGEPAGYRSLPAGSARQTLPYGHSRESLPQHPGLRQRDQGLAHLRRFCPSAYPDRPQALRQRRLWGKTGAHRLRPGFQHHRFMSFSLSLGQVQKEQGGSENPYPAGLSRQYTHLHLDHPREGLRCVHSRPIDPGTGSLLHNGSGLHRFRPLVCSAPPSGLLCNQGQEQFQIPPVILSSSGQIHRPYLRPDGNTDRHADQERLPGKNPANQILRSGNPNTVRFSDQQLCASSYHHRQTLQMSLAGGTIFQMDQATPKNQSLLRHIRECRENPNLDCHIGLCPDSYYQKTTSFGIVSLHNSTNFEHNFVGKRAYITNTC